MVAKRRQHVEPSIIAISWVEMLRSFGRGFKGEKNSEPRPQNTIVVRRGTSFQITDQHHHQFYMEIPNPPTPRPLPSEEAK